MLCYHCVRTVLNLPAPCSAGCLRNDYFLRIDRFYANQEMSWLQGGSLWRRRFVCSSGQTYRKRNGANKNARWTTFAYRTVVRNNITVIIIVLIWISLLYSSCLHCITCKCVIDSCLNWNFLLLLTNQYQYQHIFLFIFYLFKFVIFHHFIMQV